jgi:HK97 family phage major capsid protein
MAMSRDQFAWVDLGATAYPYLHRRVIELTMPALRLKQLLPDYIIPVGAGRTATFVKQKGSRAVALQQVAEGSIIPHDYTEYETFTVTPYKVARAVRITRELLEDAVVNVVEDQLRRLARIAAKTIDEDVQRVIDEAALPTQTFSASGSSVFYTGTVTTIPGTIGVNDIVKAKAMLEQVALIADAIALNPVQVADLSAIPQFASQEIFGRSIYAQGFQWEEGNAPALFGLTPIITPIVPAGTSYVLSSGRNLSGAYAPFGAFVIKRDFSVDVQRVPREDLFDIIVTMRYAPVVLYAEAIVKMVGLKTSLV